MFLRERREENDARAARLAGANGSTTPSRRSTATNTDDRAVDTLLLAHIGADRRADFVMLAGVGGNPRRSSILLFPTRAQIETISLGLHQIAEVPTLGEDHLLATTIENLLGTRVSKILMLNDVQLLAALDAAGPTSVDLANPVRIRDAERDVSFPAGKQTLEPVDLTLLMGRLETGDERDHLMTLHAAVLGWIERLRDQTVAAATVRRFPELETLVNVASNGDMPKQLTIPVDPAGVAGDVELFRVDRKVLGATIENGFPYALGGSAKRPRLQLLNGTGAVGLAQDVAACLVPAGFEVVLTANVAGFGVEETTFAAPRGVLDEVAPRLEKILGVGRARNTSRSSNLFDVSVVIGADFKGCASPAGG